MTKSEVTPFLDNPDGSPVQEFLRAERNRLEFDARKYGFRLDDLNTLVFLRSLNSMLIIWSEPGAEAKSTDALAGTVDIAQTIMDRARIEPYNGIQGRSLMNAIAGDDDPDAVDSVIVEDDQQRVYFGYSKPPRIRSIITDTHRLTVSSGETWGELYDLQSDPLEMSNLFDDPNHAAVRAELFERLSHRQMELVDTSPMPTKRA